MLLINQITAIEIGLIRYLMRISNRTLDGLMIGLTCLGDGPVWISIGVAIMIAKPFEAGHIFISLVPAVITANLLFIGLKRLTGRQRPYEAVPDIHPIVLPPDYYSFPSGHSLNAFTFATIYARYLGEPFALPLSILAGGIALSRVYLRLHYPTDVVVGSLLGYGVATFTTIA